MAGTRLFVARTPLGWMVRLAGGLAVMALAHIAWITAALINEASPVRVSSDATSLEALMDDWASHPSIPGVILRVDQGQQTLFQHAAGFTRKSADEALTPETQFHTASVGKLFTAATVLRLSERGLIDLDAPVATYLGEERLANLLHFNGKHYAAQMTVRQLLGHRAGLGNTDHNIGFGLTVLFNSKKSFSQDDLLEAAGRVPAVGPPGEQEAYASPGYYLAGLIIEEVTAQPFHLVVRAEIFDRLCMTETLESNQEWDRSFPYLHHYAGWIDLSEHNPSFEFADGGFVTTARDLSLFGRAILDGELFEKAETAQAFIAPWQGEETISAHRGLGPGVVRDNDLPTIIWHSGYWGVYFLVYPNTDTIVSMTFAQSRADYRAFWETAKPYLDTMMRKQSVQR